MEESWNSMGENLQLCDWRTQQDQGHLAKDRGIVSNNGFTYQQYPTVINLVCKPQLNILL